MTVTFAWSITQLETAPTEDGLTDVVKTAHWTLNASEVNGGKTYQTGYYGSVGFGAPDPQDFTAYAGLTFDEVIGWIKNTLGQTQVDNIKEALAQDIENQKNPPIVVLPLPWV